MTTSCLHALSSVDGRYADRLGLLSSTWSEFALIKNRLRVEVDYLCFLSINHFIPTFSSRELKLLEAVVFNFDDTAALEIKKIESQIHHDVKAVEYYLRSYLQLHKIPGSEWIHIGLTSEDTNSIAYGIAFRQTVTDILVPSINALLRTLCDFSVQTKDIVMLARTHGQPAVPTTIGKEVVVFAKRLADEWDRLLQLSIDAKCSGAVGTYAAQLAAFPTMDVIKMMQEFIGTFGLQPVVVTTQIVPADSYVLLFDSLRRINTILISFNQDCWRYCSDGYFVLQSNAQDVGSSTMPQKVNPIDFEQSEGNLGIANALFGHFSSKLPISRLQRDLSDSVVKRQFGTAFGHCLLGYQSTLKGLGILTPNTTLLSSELDDHWEIITEGIQTILRTAGDENAYEKLKALSRGKRVTKESLTAFIDSLSLPTSVKDKLHVLRPETYVGIASSLVTHTVSEIESTTT
ncbi:adenylosuccinate lyase [Candidatus Woesebacteria bacterium]|nr:adenylosuccinate lyase [Candidatus Woesebacteria bacterium]